MEGRHVGELDRAIASKRRRLESSGWPLNGHVRVDARGDAHFGHADGGEINDGNLNVENAALVDGYHHYLELVPRIRDLKRDGKLEEAFKLAALCMAATERERAAWEAIGEFRHTPPPAYAQEAAIIARKLRRPDLEVWAIERYLNTPGGDKNKELRERPAKARVALAKHSDSAL